MIIKHRTTEKICGDLLTKTFQGSKFRRFISVILGKSRAGKPSQPMSVLDIKVAIISDVMGNIIKLEGGMQACTPNWRVKVHRKLEITGGAIRIRSG